MKKVTLILSIITLIFAYSCGNDSNKKTESKAEKSGIYEPTSQEEFVNLLDNLGIKPYPGAVITGFEHKTDAVLNYKVPAKDNSNKAIFEYYKKAFEQVLKDKKDWKPFNTSYLAIQYMKGMHELDFYLMLTSKSATYDLKGLDAADYGVEKEDSLSYSITLGDGAISY
jgi:hypothetical protein